MPVADLPDLDATELSRRIASRELSCREAMQAALARIEALNPRFNAIVSLREPEKLQADPVLEGDLPSALPPEGSLEPNKIGRASCRERV